MARRGRKRRLEVEARYWELIMSGVGTFEACRRVGIGHKTGYRWRHENGGLPPQRLAEAHRSNRYLSRLERQRIATLHAQGVGVREIARRLDRNPSTVSRELRRNTRPHDGGIYDADLAHTRTRQRAARPKGGILVADEELRTVVQAKLEVQWSPEQIAAHLREEYPERPAWHVCHETIYQGLYRGGHTGLSRSLTKNLRSRRPLRRRRKRADKRDTRFVAPAKLIDARPEIVDSKIRFGDWEGDCIIGRLAQSAIGTLVERRSGTIKLIRLPNGRGAEMLHQSLRSVVGTLPPWLWLTLTWDQGSEMASHDKIEELFKDGVYFAHPGSPWERGANENANGYVG